ncbi:putative DnaJ domain-containing protein [Lupinus albus]|uniref:Putative DnaJ domain-containing protein n=1 Tax=Lupinus albus TaxID=3870 RepID=A0A6A4PUV1_LUPAL|nr:putative DnaJ domain-containing protein [Lupinus albus]
MNTLSLSSNLSISKPFHCLPFSNKQQRPSHMKFVIVSCRTIKVKSNDTNLYNILSLSPKSATMDDIKKSYRSMALQHHPDVCHDPSMKEECTRMFVKVNAAYETLSNPMLREEYDCELGLRRRMISNVGVSEDEKWRRRWQQQVGGLKMRSRTRMGQKGGSWGNRMRTQNMKN